MNHSIEWKTIDHIHTQKTADWYWIVGIVTLSIVLICVILNDVIFGILIAVSSITLSLFAAREPHEINVKIDSTGVQISNQKYLYDNLESFWIETSDAFPRILIKSKKFFMPYITALLDDVDQNKLRDILLLHLPESKHSEPLFDKLLIRLGF